MKTCHECGGVVFCPLHEAAEELRRLVYDAEWDIKQRAMPGADWLARAAKVLKRIERQSGKMKARTP